MVKQAQLEFKFMKEEHRAELKRDLIYPYLAGLGGIGIGAIAVIGHSYLVQNFDKIYESVKNLL